MTDQDLHSRLRAAMGHAAPDDLDGVLSRCKTRKGDIVPMNAATKPAANRRRALSWLAAACLLLVLFGGGVGLQQANAVASVVSLDVNPSIQLTVNRNETVLSCTPMNQDAQQVLGDMDLKGTKLNVAVNAIVGSLLQHGYLDSLSSAILISVEDKNPDRAAKLQQELTGTVDTALKNAAANASVLSQTITQDAGLEQQAKQYSISTGKAALVNQVTALNGELDFAQLAALSVEELNDLIEAGAPAMPIGRDRAAYLAQKHAGLTALDALTYEVDPELDERPAHYEVELYTPQAEYDYTIDAYSGAVLSWEKRDIPAGGSVSDGTAALITAEQAKSAALKHAGLKASQVSDMKVELDEDDGRVEYDVEFWRDGTEYDYTIDAYSGAVLKSEKEVHQQDTPSGDLITAEQAKSAALKHAGLKASQVSDMKVELDEDDGRVEYEVEFWHNTTEYDYTIDGATGDVLKSEKEVHQQDTPSDTLITAEQAKSAALKHAGLKASQVSDMKVELDEDDGRVVYDVEFWYDTTEYDYTIDGATGDVLKSEKEVHQQDTPSGDLITAEQAKSAALKHAGLKASQVSGMKVELDEDDGRVEYDVEFWHNTTEYDYTIDGATGDVLKSEKEVHQQDTPSDTLITAEQAKSAALKHAGLSEGDVSDLKAEADLDDDTPHYDVEFSIGDMEYEYEISAGSGQVLSHHAEQDD